jgi:type VI secretion system protein ImpE
MDATALYRAGRLDEAITALGQRLRDDPTDRRSRTFLFELLCFAGQHDRAEKHLDLLADGGTEAEMGAWLYRSALHADRTRLEMFRTASLPGGREARPVSGTQNGKPFEALEDADPRIGARLEVFAAGAYQWIPFQLLSSIEIEEPSKLRDLLWITARVLPADRYRGGELGEVILPVLTPLSQDHPEGTVRLGMETRWEEDAEAGEIPMGQKLLLVDGEDIPLLEVRTLEITPPSGEDG